MNTPLRSLAVVAFFLAAGPGLTPLFGCDNYTFGGLVGGTANPVTTAWCGAIAQLLPITEVSPPAGGSGAGPDYQWQFSLDGLSWVDIDLAAGRQRDLFPATLAGYLATLGYNAGQSAWFRRGVRRTACPDFVYSNLRELRVYQPVTDPGALAPIFSYCASNGPCFSSSWPQITLSAPTGGDQPYAYVWEESADGLTWQAFSDEYQPLLCTTPGARTFLRRGVKPAGSPCAFSYTNTLAYYHIIDDFEPLLEVTEPSCSDQQNGQITVVDLNGNNQDVLALFMYSLNGGPTVQNNVFTDLGVGAYTIQMSASVSKCTCADEYISDNQYICDLTTTVTATPAPVLVDVAGEDPGDCGGEDGSIVVISCTSRIIKFHQKNVRVYKIQSLRYRSP